MKVQVGEVVLLDDNKEYICFAKKSGMELLMII